MGLPKPVCSPRKGPRWFSLDVLDEDGMKVEASIQELAVETTYLHLDLYNHCRLGSSTRNKPSFNNPIKRPIDSPFVNKGML